MNSVFFFTKHFWNIHFAVLCYGIYLIATFI